MPEKNRLQTFLGFILLCVTILTVTGETLFTILGAH